MKKVDIINETIKFYSKDPSRRSTKAKKCLYKGPNDKRCAFGRCMTEEALKLIDEKTNGQLLSFLIDTLSYNSDDIKELDDIVQDKYKGHDIEFWKDLQLLHDDELNWNTDENKGLSMVGKREAKELITEYS